MPAADRVDVEELPDGWWRLGVYSDNRLVVTLNIAREPARKMAQAILHQEAGRFIGRLEGNG